jgi:hypothetical protein
MARAAKNKRNNNKLVAADGGIILGTDPDLIEAESKSSESKDDYGSKGNDDDGDYDSKSSHK